MKRLALFAACFLLAGCFGMGDCYYDDMVYYGPVVEDGCCTASSRRLSPAQVSTNRTIQSAPGAPIQQVGHQLSAIQTREPELLNATR
ncbi:MAG: hypothetical protein L0Y72_08120 [Gemmataceae bacterium]|nr:hypothetical protein [Gemmataceae bacterium]MCI0738994.1 hypothetical protein [Gemmataceae bacterium]